MITPLLIAAVVGYLLGSLPFGYLVARAKGVNIFEVGSKNPGATNVRRVLGSGPGNLVLILDAAKGAAAAAIPWEEIIKSVFQPGQVVQLHVAGLGGALVGHSFSCFTGFRGGKGVATGAGGFTVLFPLGALIAIAVWGLALAATRYVSLASILAAASLPFSAFFLRQSVLLIMVSAVVAVFVALRHRANISRLLAGTESRLGRKKAGDPKS